MEAKDYNKKYVPIFAPDGFPSISYCQDFNKIVEDFGYGTAFMVEIKNFQKLSGLKVDGYCGPATINKMAEEDKNQNHYEVNNFIIVGPKIYPTNISVVNYWDDFKIGDTSSRVRTEKVIQAVLHHDVTFNARSTEKILQSRGYSTHFIIDGDVKGTIYQCHNPTLRVAFHAGVNNNMSVGIDLNNPADPSYEKSDAQRRGRKRGLTKVEVHGRMERLLGYFPNQYKSLNALLKILSDSIGIKEKTPDKEDGSVTMTTIPNADKFEGIIGHYHITKRKIDPASLEWEEIYFKKNTGGQQECQKEKVLKNGSKSLLEMIRILLSKIKS